MISFRRNIGLLDSVQMNMFRWNCGIELRREVMQDAWRDVDMHIIPQTPCSIYSGDWTTLFHSGYHSPVWGLCFEPIRPFKSLYIIHGYTVDSLDILGIFNLLTWFVTRSLVLAQWQKFRWCTESWSCASNFPCFFADNFSSNGGKVRRSRLQITQVHDAWRGSILRLVWNQVVIRSVRLQKKVQENQNGKMDPLVHFVVLLGSCLGPTMIYFGMKFGARDCSKPVSKSSNIIAIHPFLVCFASFFVGLPRSLWTFSAHLLVPWLQKISWKSLHWIT